ncbi:MAG TPA: protein YgfX [Azospira sp.]|nr:protein YgfX [Azospira sp.]
MRFPVTLDVKPSRRLRAALVFAHLAAVLALWLSAIDWRLALAGSVLLSLALLVHWRGLRPWRLRLAADGGLYRLAANDDAAKMAVLPGAVVTRWLVVARVRDEREGRARALLVLSDSLSPDEFRALRIWLRWLASFRISGARA